MSASTPIPAPTTSSAETEQRLEVDSIGSVDPLAVVLAAEINQGSSSSASGAATTSTATIRNATGSSSAAASSSSGSATTRGAVNSFETLLSSGSFSQILDVPPDTDDEAMMELAIALSLQDEGGSADLQVLRQGFQQNISNLQGLENLQNLSGPALQSLQTLAAQGLVQVQTTSQVSICKSYKRIIKESLETT